MLVHGDADCGVVHDVDGWASKSLLVRQMVEFNCIVVLCWVFVVDTIDLCCFYHNITIHFLCEIERSGVRRQERPANATTTMATFLINEGTRRSNYGIAGAASVVLFVVALALALTYQKFVLGRDNNNERPAGQRRAAR